MKSIIILLVLTLCLTAPCASGRASATGMTRSNNMKAGRDLLQEFEFEEFDFDFDGFTLDDFEVDGPVPSSPSSGGGSGGSVSPQVPGPNRPGTPSSPGPTPPASIPKASPAPKPVQEPTPTTSSPAPKPVQEPTPSTSIPPPLPSKGQTPAGATPPKMNCKVLEEGIFNMYWTVKDNLATITLQGKLEDNSYMSFGFSQDKAEGVMIGSEVVIAGVAGGKPFAQDFVLSSKTPCRGSSGVCPAANSAGTTVVGGSASSGVTSVTFTKVLDAKAPVSWAENEPVAAVWAHGPLAPGSSEVAPTHHESRSPSNFKLSLLTSTSEPGCQSPLAPLPTGGLTDTPLGPSLGNDTVRPVGGGRPVTGGSNTTTGGNTTRSTTGTSPRPLPGTSPAPVNQAKTTCALSLEGGKTVHFQGCHSSEGLGKPLRLMYNATRNPDGNTSLYVGFETALSPGEYLGVGFAKTPKLMDGGSAVVLKNINGTWKLSSYALLQQVMDPSRAVKEGPAPLSFTEMKTATSAKSTVFASFRVVVDKPYDGNLNTDMLFAWGKLDGEKLRFHNQYDYPVVNFKTLGATAGASKKGLDLNLLRKIHGLMMAVGFGILIPLGIMFAHCYKSWDPHWFRAHVCCQVLGYLLGAGGFALGIYIGNQNSQEFTIHRYLGIAVIALGGVQILLGLIRPKPGSGSLRSSWEVAHKLLGAVVTLGALANIYLGILDVYPKTVVDSDRNRMIYIIVFSVVLFLIAVRTLFVPSRKKAATRGAPGKAMDKDVLDVRRNSPPGTRSVPGKRTHQHGPSNNPAFRDKLYRWYTNKMGRGEPLPQSDIEEEMNRGAVKFPDEQKGLQKIAVR